MASSTSSTSCNQQHLLQCLRAPSTPTATPTPTHEWGLCPLCLHQWGLCPYYASISGGYAPTPQSVGGYAPTPQSNPIIISIQFPSATSSPTRANQALQSTAQRSFCPFPSTPLTRRQQSTSSTCVYCKSASALSMISPALHHHFGALREWG